DRNRRGDADRSLRAVLIAVERALRAAQRVVLDDDAERRRAGVALVSGDERGLETADSGLDIEVVRPQIIDELSDRPFFFESDFRMRRDVVGDGEELVVHQLLRPATTSSRTGFTAVRRATQ